MNQAELLRYLTEIDREIHKLMSPIAQKCPYLPCEFYNKFGYSTNEKEGKKCEDNLDYSERYRVCYIFGQNVIDQIAGKLAVPDELVSFLISKIYSFDDIPCSFRNDCIKYSKENPTCNDALNLFILMKLCKLYKNRWTKEIIDFWNNAKPLVISPEIKEIIAKS